MPGAGLPCVPVGWRLLPRAACVPYCPSLAHRPRAASHGALRPSPPLAHTLAGAARHTHEAQIAQMRAQLQHAESQASRATEHSSALESGLRAELADVQHAAALQLKRSADCVSGWDPISPHPRPIRAQCAPNQPGLLW